MKLYFSIATASLVAGLALADQVSSGQLCWYKDSQTPPSCVITAATAERVPREPAPNYFVWRSADRKSITVDRPGAGEKSVTSAEDPRRGTVKLKIENEGRRWPRVITFSLKRGTDRWRWQLQTTEARRLASLVLPAGSWDLEVVGGPGFRQIYFSALVVMAKKTVSLGSVALVPLPGIAGRVIVADASKGIADAEIRGEPGNELLGKTAADGRFAVAAEGMIPRAIRIVARDHASRIVEIDPFQAEIDLGDIALEGGADLRIIVRGVTVDRDELEAELLPKSKSEAQLPGPGSKSDEPRPKGVIRESTAGDALEVTFSHVAPGEYFVLLSGRKPLQRLAHPVVVERGDITTDITVKPVLIEGYVTRGREPAPNQELLWFTVRPKTWQTNLSTDAEGHYSVEFWQQGVIAVMPRTAGARSGFEVQKRIGNADREFWDIAIPGGMIIGRVTDAQTDAPVVDATVFVDFKGAETAFGGRAIRTTSDGRFRLISAAPGRYTLRVEAEEYLPSNPTTFELSDGEAPVHETSFVLDRSRAIWIRVSDDRGNSIPNPYVVSDLQYDGRASGSPVMGNATGVIRLPIAEATGRQTVFLFSQGGSYAKLRIDRGAPNSEEKPLMAQLPTTRGGMRVRITAEDGARVAGRQLLLRFNGEMIPPAVLELMAMTQWEKYVAGPDGVIVLPKLPPGAYEVWTYRGQGEYERILRTFPDDGKSSVAVGDGIADVTVAVPK